MRIIVAPGGAANTYNLEVSIRKSATGQFADVYKQDGIGISGLGLISLQAHWGSGVVFEKMDIT